MYESRSEPLLSRWHFARRLSLHALASGALVTVSLLIGMEGYMYFERLPWVDAFLNSAMLLGGMGPVDAPQTDAGKLFAGFYALYAGLVFLVAAGVFFAPVVHRVIHKLHHVEAIAAQAHGKKVKHDGTG